jgi:hypothetical protein
MGEMASRKRKSATHSWIIWVVSFMTIWTTLLFAARFASETAWV